MTESSSGTHDDDDDLPIYLPPGGAGAVPQFCDHLIEYLLSGPAESEFTFEGVDVEESQGVWLLPLGGYDPDVDRARTTPPDPTLPPGGYAEVAETSAEAVLSELRAAWGDPSVRTPRLVGTSREPEGLLDYLMITVGVEQAEMWDRGELCCVVITSWDGEPRESMLRQVLAILPRAFALGGFAAVVGDEITIHDLLMHGEGLVELRRRAWVLSTLFGESEVRVRGTLLEASRFSLRSRGATTTVWTFTDDGRALVLLHDPASEFSRTAADQLIADHLADDSDLETDADMSELRDAATMILVSRMLDGVPDELRELIAAPAENSRGEAAEHQLEFLLSSDGPLPIISGAAWFDGEHWRVPAGLLEIGSVNDFGMDDLGFADAVRRPFRLGGEFTVDTFVSPHERDRARREGIERVFAACPYPEQPRPATEDRLGYGLPRDVSHAEIVRQIERVTSAWWDVDPEHTELRDDTFRIGGRHLGGSTGRLLRSVIAVAEPWTFDILMAWVDGLHDAMEARWGAAGELQARDARTGFERKTPVARVMRGVGLMTAPIWWVNGHAVLLIAGAPDPSYDEEPQAILVIARADAVLDVMRGTRTWDLRQRARVLETLTQLTSGSAPTDEISWNGPRLAGSDLTPSAPRGRFRAGDHYWVWHFAHDGRGLLLSFLVDERAREDKSFADQAELFSGVPEDLLSLVVDRDPDGLFPVITRPLQEEVPDAGILSAAISLPAVQAVIWRDAYDWRLPEGLLRRVRPDLSAAEGVSADAPETADPLAVLNSSSLGVPQLQRALFVGDDLTRDVLVDERYARDVFDRTPAPSEVMWAFAELGDVHERALVGSMNQFLDATPGMPDSRYVLDAALANPDARHRREIVLLLLEGDVDASIQLSHLTPINVLFDNPTLGAQDLPLVERLLNAHARPGMGLGGIGIARHPIVQLVDRSLAESDIAPLIQALLDEGGDEGLVRPVLADGRTVIEYVESTAFPHGHTRAGILAQLREAAADQEDDLPEDPFA